MGGVSTALKAIKPAIKVWGVETQGADAMTQALAANKVVPITPTSLAKTLCAPYVSQETLALAQTHLEEVLLVSDKDAYHALRLILERAKLCTELAAACTLAAAKSIKNKLGEHVVLIMCGGNVSLADICFYQRSFE
jgi:threonine dehydratase